MLPGWIRDRFKKSSRQRASVGAGAEYGPAQGTVKLAQLIPPEIKNDQFYFELNKIAADHKLRTFLEIGSSSGEGSTEAIVTALRARPDRDQVRLFCMEISSERFAKLRHTYAGDAFVKPYNLPSVSTEQFPSEEEVTYFYNAVRTNLNRYPCRPYSSGFARISNTSGRRGATSTASSTSRRRIKLRVLILRSSTVRSLRGNAISTPSPARA